jgi:hypothetical protein
MVKEIRVILDEVDYERLKKKKGTKSWKQFFIEGR